MKVIVEEFLEIVWLFFLLFISGVGSLVLIASEKLTEFGKYLQDLDPLG